MQTQAKATNRKTNDECFQAGVTAERQRVLRMVQDQIRETALELSDIRSYPAQPGDDLNIATLRGELEALQTIEAGLTGNG